MLDAVEREAHQQAADACADPHQRGHHDHADRPDAGRSGRGRQLLIVATNAR
jgi:hypothetical protein